jgi:competence protein ComFC
MFSLILAGNGGKPSLVLYCLYQTGICLGLVELLYGELWGPRNYGIVNTLGWRWVFSSSGQTTSFGPPGVQTAFHAFFSLFFPDDCRVCGRPLQAVTRIPLCRECLLPPEPFRAEYFCASCRTPFLNAFPLDSEGRCALCRQDLRGFDAAYCFGSYQGLLREWLHLYKYGRVKTMGRLLDELLSAALPRDERFDAIVPVPLHWRRRWQRGFNQSELLASGIARRSGVPVIAALRRVRHTATQTGLSNTSRRRNVAGAFEVRRRRPVAGKRILLIDDVMTTGSTVASCAAALRRAGALRIVVLTVARADRRVPAVPTRPADFPSEESVRNGQ